MLFINLLPFIPQCEEIYEEEYEKTTVTRGPAEEPYIILDISGLGKSGDGFQAVKSWSISELINEQTTHSDAAQYCESCGAGAVGGFSRKTTPFFSSRLFVYAGRTRRGEGGAGYAAGATKKNKLLFSDLEKEVFGKKLRCVCVHLGEDPTIIPNNCPASWTT